MQKLFTSSVLKGLMHVGFSSSVSGLVLASICFNISIIITARNTKHESQSYIYSKCFERVSCRYLFQRLGRTFRNVADHIDYTRSVLHILTNRHFDKIPFVGPDAKTEQCVEHTKQTFCMSFHDITLPTFNSAAYDVALIVCRLRTLCSRNVKIGGSQITVTS